MLVLAVGHNTQWGKIKSLIIKDNNETPLQVHFFLIKKKVLFFYLRNI